MPDLKTFLQSFNILTTDEIDSFIQLGKSKRIKNGGFFIQEGKVCQEVAFIESGLFRSFYYSSTSEEVTYCFTFSNAFLTAYSSFISQDPTSENIEALTDVELLSFSRNDILKFEQESTNWLRLSKMIAEAEYIKMERRVFLLQKEAAEKRYSELMKQHPEYLQQIPLSYLASYLGITQRHLSRIRASN